MKFAEVEESFIRKVSVQFDLFHLGPNRKTTKAEIAEVFGVRPRVIERVIYVLRQRGVPILADGEGYWLATDPAEFHHPLNSLRHRMGEIGRTLQALEHSRERMLHEVTTEPGGQKRMF